MYIFTLVLGTEVIAALVSNFRQQKLFSANYLLLGIVYVLGKEYICFMTKEQLYAVVQVLQDMPYVTVGNRSYVELGELNIRLNKFRAELREQDKDLYKKVMLASVSGTY